MMICMVFFFTLILVRRPVVHLNTMIGGWTDMSRSIRLGSEASIQIELNPIRTVT